MTTEQLLAQLLHRSRTSTPFGLSEFIPGHYNRETTLAFYDFMVSHSILHDNAPLLGYKHRWNGDDKYTEYVFHLSHPEDYDDSKFNALVTKAEAIEASENFPF